MKVVLVNYLNSRPFLYGLRTLQERYSIEIIEAYPSQCAKILRSGRADIGLIPVGALDEIPRHKIISNYCIGCDGEVMTVAIYSNVPIQEVQTIYLDYQSMTSIKLARILLEHYWKKEVEYIDAREGYIDRVGNMDGAVIIGDRTFAADTQFVYKYDLGKYWKKLTGLPFCFAVWTTIQDLNKEKIILLNEAFEMGMTMIDRIILQEDAVNVNLNAYFNHYIDYQFDEPKRQALNRYVNYLKYKPVKYYTGI